MQTYLGDKSLGAILSSTPVDRRGIAHKIWAEIPREELTSQNSYFTDKFGAAIAEAGLNQKRPEYSVSKVGELTVITYRKQPYIVKVAPEAFENTNSATLDAYIRPIRQDQKEIREHISEKEGVKANKDIFVGVVLYVPFQMFGKTGKEKFTQILPETQFVDLNYNRGSIDAMIYALKEGRM